MAKPGSNGRRTGDPRARKHWRELLAASATNGIALAVRRYLEALTVQQFSPATTDKRCQDLLRFVAWCVARELRVPAEITRPILERYQRHIAEIRKPDGAPLAVNYQLGALHALQGLFRWLVKSQHLDSNPAADLDLPRLPLRRLPEPLTVAEIESALAVLDVDIAVELRDRAMWELLYSTGLRRAELMRLQVGDIDPAGGTLFVRQGKGRKDRLVPIGARALAWLGKYQTEVRGMWANEQQETLFVNPNGRPLTLEALSHRARTLLNRAGIKKPGACHLFRHTMATQMLEHGADVRYVQEMLGHAHLNTTQVYTHVSIGKLKAVHAATHPGAKLQKQSGEGSRESGDRGGGLTPAAFKPTAM